jgi:Ras-related protein Rab-2A
MLTASEIESIPLTFKYILVGDTCVGKTCLLLQFTNHKFEQMYDVTIGVEFGTYTHYIGNHAIKMQVWDTAGQENFRSITRAYFRSAVCALVVFDITSRESFNNIRTWIQDVNESNKFVTTIVLVGNKADLEHKRVISYEEAKKYADENNALYIETSAKNGKNVDDAFLLAMPKIYELVKYGHIDLDIVSTYHRDLTRKRLLDTKDLNINVNHGYCSYCQ